MPNLEAIIWERGRCYWIDRDGERISPCFDAEDDAWQWADEQDDEA